jgi:hypothetical protein
MTCGVRFIFLPNPVLRVAPPLSESRLLGIPEGSIWLIGSVKGVLRACAGLIWLIGLKKRVLMPLVDS